MINFLPLCEGARQCCKKFFFSGDALLQSVHACLKAGRNLRYSKCRG